MNGGMFSRSGVNSPELREDSLLQAQVLVSVLLHQGPLPLDGVLHAAAHGLGQLGADLLLGSLQLDPQGLLVLELSGGEEEVKTLEEGGGTEQVKEDEEEEEVEEEEENMEEEKEEVEENKKEVEEEEENMEEEEVVEKVQEEEGVE